MTAFERRDLAMTLLSGKPVSLGSQRGRVHGAKVDQDGTLNAPSWLGKMINIRGGIFILKWNMYILILLLLH